jgi:hypothetical protein
MNFGSFFISWYHAITVIFHVLKLISILIAPFILLTTVVAGFDTSALASAANVVEHYQHHVKEHGQTNLSVIEFLLSHFSTSAEPDDEHNGLPLLGGLHANSVTAIPVLGIRILSFVAPLSDVLPEPLLEHSVTPTFAQSIFQPPRA